MDGQPQTIYSQYLETITDAILVMGEQAKASLEYVKAANLEPDEELRFKVKANDKEINRLQDTVEDEIIRMVAMQPPFSADLRYILSAVKIASGLERIGDFAKNSTKYLVTLPVDYQKQAHGLLDKMLETNVAMLENSLQALRDRDASEALNVWKTDEQVDEMCDECFDVIRQQMQQEPEYASDLASVLMIAKNLERVSDYCADIAKMVIFITTGKHPTKGMLDDTSSCA
jgi:phosphate transport system protein